MKKIQLIMVAVIILASLVSFLPSQAEGNHVVRHLGVAPLLGPVPTLSALQCAVRNKYWSRVVPAMRLLGYNDNQASQFYQAVMKGEVEDTTLRDYFGSYAVNLSGMAWYGRTRRNVQVKVRALGYLTLDTGRNEHIWVVNFCNGNRVLVPKACGNICPLQPRCVSTPEPRPTVTIDETPPPEPRPTVTPTQTPEPPPPAVTPTPTKTPEPVPTVTPSLPPPPKATPTQTPVQPPPSSPAPQNNINLNFPKAPEPSNNYVGAAGATAPTRTSESINVLTIGLIPVANVDNSNRNDNKNVNVNRNRNANTNVNTNAITVTQP